MAQGSEGGSKGKALGYSDVLDILQIVDGVGDGCELTVDVGDFHLHFVKEDGDGTAAATAPASPPTPGVPTAETKGVEPAVPQAVEVRAPEPASVSEAADSDLFEVMSPMVGTFYRRPAPDKPPFVDIGQDVGPEDPVCLVEVMKLFNTIPAGQAGRIAEICIEDSAPVAVGQVLMRIEPAT